MKADPSNMDINEEVFEKMLARLEPDLGDTTARYKQLRLKLIKFFQWKRCHDAEILADETIARTIKNLIKGDAIQADNPYVYVFGIARHVYNEFVRKEIKGRTLLANFPQPAGEPAESADCRIECLLKLPPNKLQLLQEYFLDEKSSQQLAEELNTTLNGLRLQIYRLKRELDSCYEDCRKKLSKG
ncbi:MAG: RNA polymerase sigma factor [Blastocatellia bacterium]